MGDKKQWIPAAGFVATIGYALYMVAQMGAQGAREPVTGDYSNAAIAEVRNAQGHSVLRGQFAPVAEEDDDIERKATLTPVGSDADAAGDAEVEVTKATPTEQEIEFSIKNVEPGAAFTFVIDGRVIGTTKADTRGRAEIEVDVARRAAAK